MMTYLHLRRRTMEILDQGEDGDTASIVCDWFIVFMVISNVICIILESVPQIETRYGGFFRWYEHVSVVIFSAEYALRIWSNGSRYHPQSLWRGRKEYIFGFGLIDLAAIIPFYLQAFVPGLDLLVLRALRLIRLFKLSHYSTAIEDLFSAIYTERRSFYATLYLLLIAMIMTSTFMYFAERDHQPEKFGTIPDAIYWSMITLTTVGYGDVTPITWLGKVISLVTAFMGVSVVALLTGIVANAFANQLSERRILYEAQVREALQDGVLDEAEKATLEALRHSLNLSEEQARAFFAEVSHESNVKVAAKSNSKKKRNSE